jgi:signal transduction histidine kinase/ligand-binding sensor domain-containing protein
MTFKSLCISLLFATATTCALAQNQSNGQYLIKNYSSKEYGASFSNLRVIQSQSGLIYIGNLDGLLLYDGTRWQKPLDFQIVSIAENSNGGIFVGTSGDFGYLKANHQGELLFVSLKTLLNNKLELASTVWEITPTIDGVYFYSKQGIFKWGENKMKVWSSTEYQWNIFYQDNLYVIKKGEGLVKLHTTGDELIKGTEVLADHNLSLLELHVESLLIGTRQNGFYILNNSGRLQKLDGNSEQFLKRNELFDYEINPDNKTQRYIVGSFKGGVALIDDAYDLTDIIDTKNGLQSDIIKGLALDTDNNLWCAMQEGISFVELSSPWKTWEKSGIEGTPWCLQRIGETLYIGTTRGLFYLEEGTFKKINGIDTKVWSLSNNKNSKEGKNLMVATSKGVFIVSNKKAIIVNSGSSTNIITPSRAPNKVLLSKSIGLTILSQNSGFFDEQILMTFDNKDQTFHDAKEDRNGNIWLGAKKKGVYKISEVNSNNPKIKLYTSIDGLVGNLEPSIVKINKGLLVGTESGLFKYDSLTDRFGLFNNISEDINRLAALNDSTFYASIRAKNGQSKIEKLILSNDGSLVQIAKPFNRLKTNTVSFIYPDINGITWFATSDGLYSFDEKVKKDYSVPFNTLIRKVTNLDSLIFAGSYTIPSDDSVVPKFVIDQPTSYEPTLDYANNSIRFEYAATSYEMPEKNVYSYFLEGNDKSWSSWNAESVKEYNNLSAGNYTFHVKSKNAYDTEGRTAIYRFVILPPWYQTGWAYGLFTLCGGLFVWFMMMAYSYRIRQQGKKLKLIVADRTFEVLSQKKKIEKQNKLLIDKNEEITLQRDNINEKNQELEISQEEILSINEKLHELNTMLEKKVEQRTSKIKSTLNQLQKTNTELDTFIYRASHDLKGPITRIHGLTSLARLESTSPNDLKYYELIEHVARDMQKLLSKMTQAHEMLNYTVEKESIDLPVIISDVRDSINFLNGDDVDMKYSFDLENTLSLKSDKFLFSIILTNLMENALIFRKNYPGEEQHIFIKSYQDNTNYYITISDSGIGISKEHIEKIFNMFFRGSDQTKGSGLGLYLVKVAVEKLNGKITVESTFGKSTTFSITLPKGS